MKQFPLSVLLLPLIIWGCTAKLSEKNEDGYFEADNEYIRYVGRLDFTHPKKPRFWAPGVYIEARFRGKECEVLINDEERSGNHNYLEVVVDDSGPERIQTSGKVNHLKIAENLPWGDHIVRICKDTESGIGYLEFKGIKCEKLLPLPPKMDRKLEFVGNSITCGSGSDLSKIPCDSGKWFDQQNAWMSYGPRIARDLNAQWHITAVSGIGMIHSCCGMDITMPAVFDKIDQRDDSIKWDFSRYQPDAVTICLGQNDGVRDSVAFCSAYVDFIHQIRKVYPQSYILCITSPMAGERLSGVMRHYLTGIVDHVHGTGDQKVEKFIFSRSYNSGCGGHPDMDEHQLIAYEYTGFLQEKLGW